MREMNGHICRGWTASPANVAVLLTWSAIVRLAEPFVDLVSGGTTLQSGSGGGCSGSGVEELQAAAFGVGGFDAVSALLEVQEMTTSGACAQV